MGKMSPLQVLFTPAMRPANRLYCLGCKETTSLKTERSEAVLIMYGTATEVIVTCLQCGETHPFLDVNYLDGPVPKFKLGNIASTQGVAAEILLLDIMQALLRYTQADWGEVCDEDKSANDSALRDGERLLAAYRDRNGAKFWIITEWDRSVTTVLLPEEY